MPRCTLRFTSDGRLTTEYVIWGGMRQRCRDPKDAYHAMGVMVCTEWDASFEAFLRGVGPRPSKQHSLDRWPDPAGNYEPRNVRWATAIEQRNNWRPRPVPFDEDDD